MMEFCTDVGRVAQEILSITIAVDPKFFVLAKRSIASTLKSTHRPSTGQWPEEMSLCLPLQKITYTLKDKQEQFQCILGPFIN